MNREIQQSQGCEISTVSRASTGEGHWRKSARCFNDPGAKSGAAFGATLYRDLILFGASECNADNESNSFILLSLFGSVQGSATRCFEMEKRT